MRRLIAAIALALLPSMAGAQMGGSLGGGIDPFDGGAFDTLKVNLVSYWKLDEASGTRNDSKGSNNLTSNNSVAQVAGKLGNGAGFTSASSQWLSITNNSSFNALTTAASWQAWIYETSTSTNMVAAAKWTYSSQGAWAIQSGAFSSSDITVYLATSITDVGTGCRVDTSGVGITATTWYHVVVVFDGSLTGNANRLKVYVNGAAATVSQGQGNVPSSLTTSTADFNLGKFGGGLDRYWNGRLDDAAIWSRALTASEVTRLYGSGSGYAVYSYLDWFVRELRWAA